MKQRSEDFLAQVGISAKEFPLERHSSSGFYTINFHSQEIIVIELFGTANFDMINEINALLTEYNYQRTLRFPEHKSYVVVDLSANQHSLSAKQRELLHKITFLQTIVIKENKKKWYHTFMRVQQNNTVHLSVNIEEALLLILTKIKQRSGLTQTDFYTTFLDLWVKNPVRATFPDTNIKTVFDASWAMTIDSPFFYITMQVAEGNIFIAKCSGFLSSLAIDRFIMLVRAMCRDLNIRIPNQKAVLVLDASNVTSISLRMLRMISSFLIRDNILIHSIIVPSGIVQSFYILHRFTRPKAFGNWQIENNLKKAVEKAHEFQLTKGFTANSTAHKIDGSQMFAGITQDTLNELFDALQPLVSIDYLNNITTPVRNPVSLKEIVHNIVFNIKVNLEEMKNIEVKPELAQTQTENLLNFIQQPVLYCSQSQILWANAIAYSTWGYRANALTDQPLSVLLELTNITAILTFDERSFESMQLTTYHFEGHTMLLACKKIVVEEVNNNHYYLIFNTKVI